MGITFEDKGTWLEPERVDGEPRMYKPWKQLRGKEAEYARAHFRPLREFLSDHLGSNELSACILHK
jgi:hypothetical protein